MRHINVIENVKDKAGFTLVELALVIMLSAMTMLGITEFIKVHTVNFKYEQAMDHLDITQTALFEYYSVNGRYPCPTDPTLVPGDANYGLEHCRSAADLASNPDDCTGAPVNLSCTTVSARDGDQNGAPDVIMIGVVPFRTLFGTLAISGVVDTPYDESKKLSFNTLISYSTTEHMTDANKHSVVNPANSRTGSIRIEDENGTLLRDNAHYVLVSHGDNGKGGYTNAGQKVDNCFVPSVVLPNDYAALRVPPSGQSAYGDAKGFTFGEPVPGGGPGGEIENCDNNDAIFTQGVRVLSQITGFNDDIVLANRSGAEPLWQESMVSPVGQKWIYSANTGNVVIGTTSGIEKFDINGGMSAESSSVAIGYCDGIDGSTCVDPDKIGGSGSQCPNPGQAAYAIHENRILCRDVTWVMPAQSCPSGFYLVGASNRGNIKCEPSGTAGGVTLWGNIQSGGGMVVGP